MFYQLGVLGQTAMSANSPGAPLDLQIVESFGSRSSSDGVLVVEAPIETLSTTTDPNIIDVGLYLGFVFDTMPKAGEIAWASNSSIHAVYPALSGEASESIPLIDETFQLSGPSQIEAAGVGYTFDIDIDTALQSNSDIFVKNTGNDVPVQILAGTISIDFTADYHYALGQATFAGLEVGTDQGIFWEAEFGGRVFDGLEYIASYADLIAALGVNRDAGVQHFLQAGITEGRVSSFDGDQYIASNTDLILAFGANRDLGTQHFIAFGAAEGRSADNFNAAQYLENYADLQAAFGGDEPAATLHYITNGFFEGRTDDLLIG